MIFGLFPKIFNYFRKAKLEIYFDEKETYTKAPDVFLNYILSNWWHLIVKNIGKTNAKDCKWKLIKIEKYIDNDFKTIKEFEWPMLLKWAHEKDFSSKEIEPNFPIKLDLCFTHEWYDIIHFATEKYASWNITDFPVWIYKVKIKVYYNDNWNNNTVSTEKSFIVELKKWDFKSLNIKQFKN